MIFWPVVLLMMAGLPADAPRALGRQLLDMADVGDPAVPPTRSRGPPTPSGDRLPDHEAPVPLRAHQPYPPSTPDPPTTRTAEVPEPPKRSANASSSGTNRRIETPRFMID